MIKDNLEIELLIKVNKESKNIYFMYVDFKFTFQYLNYLLKISMILSDDKPSPYGL